MICLRCHCGTVVLRTTQTAAGTTETESAGTTESESAGTTEALPFLTHKKKTERLKSLHLTQKTSPKCSPRTFPFGKSRFFSAPSLQCQALLATSWHFQHVMFAESAILEAWKWVIHPPPDGILCETCGWCPTSPKLIRMFPKIMGKPPKSSTLIGFSLIFTIHFEVPLFLETPIKPMDY